MGLLRFMRDKPEVRLGDDRGLLALGVLLELGEVEGDLDEGLEADLGVLGELVRVLGVLLDIEADGGARRASARQTEDDARAVGELDVQALLGRDGAVDRVRVRKVGGGLDRERRVRARRLERLADKVGRVEQLAQVRHHRLSTLRLDLLVVVAREEAAAVLLVVREQDVVDRRAGLLLGSLGKDREPSWASVEAESSPTYQ